MQCRQADRPSQMRAQSIEEGNGSAREAVRRKSLEGQEQGVVAGALDCSCGASDEPAPIEELGMSGKCLDLFDSAIVGLGTESGILIGEQRRGSHGVGSPTLGNVSGQMVLEARRHGCTCTQRRSGHEHAADRAHPLRDCIEDQRPPLRHHRRVIDLLDQRQIHG
jgi:hypothetical protein